MSKNDDIFKDISSSDLPEETGSHDEVPASFFDQPVNSSEEEKVPGSMREDASKWDQYTDGQRKLIVFGVLFGLVFLLILLVFMGSSCTGCSCGSCRSQNRTGITSGTELPGTAVSGSQIGSDSDIAVPSGADADLPDNDGKAEVTSADAVTSTDAVSGSDDATDSDGQAEPVGLSACNQQQADNEAGDGSNNGSGGFLGFLFGCTGCADSCSISVADSLTDPVFVSGSDPTKDNLSSVSGSDANSNLWEAQLDDNAYIAMMSTELANISDCIIQLSELDSVLAQYTDPQKVRDNDRFRKLSGEMLAWCDAAEGYDAGLLSSQQATIVNQLSVRLAGHLRAYLESYPALITRSSTVSGSDFADRDDQLNIIMADIVELYAALNEFPSQPVN